MPASAPTGWFETSEEQVSNGPPTEATYVDAIRWALHDEMRSNDRVVLLGQDIGVMGGAFRATEGLHAEFGDDRVIDTPIAEAAMVGAGIGLAVMGWRPIVELQFADFISCAYDQLVTEAAKLHYRFGVPVPLVVRAPSGGGVGAGPFHSQNPEGVFAHVPGLKVVCPGDVQDAYDLLRAAVSDPNPVVFFEHKALYRQLRGTLIREAGRVRLGEAKIRRRGDDVSVVTYGGMTPRCLEVAEQLDREGISVEVVDLRTVYPLDFETVLESVRRNNRVVIVHEDTMSSGVGAEVAARLSDVALFDLDAPVRRVTAPDTPTPFASTLESEYVPSAQRIMRAIQETVAL